MSNKTKQIIRTGPHPLALHVASATQNWAGAATAFPLYKMGGMQIHPDLEKVSQTLREDIKGLKLPNLQAIIMQQAQTRLSDTLAGITAYQHHPYQRQSAPPPVRHKIGTTELLDYGQPLSHDAPVILAVPSLVNPAYILDLMEDHSFMHFLANKKIHPYLLDWTVPDETELAFKLEDYITQRLMPMIRLLHKHHNKKIHLLGYCMGGNLSIAAAQLLQKENILESLTLVATPWDFHASQPRHFSDMTDHFLKMDSFGQNTTPVPMNIMQLFFFGLDPTLSSRKFRRFGSLDSNSSEAKIFVALEDWVNDGAPLAPLVAQECLADWYRDNKPQQNQWLISGQVIDPRQLTLPGQIITPYKDRIVPPASAKALQEKLPHFDHKTVSGGHVTMMAGKSSDVTLWPIIASNLK